MLPNRSRSQSGPSPWLALVAITCLSACSDTSASTDTGNGADPGSNDGASSSGDGTAHASNGTGITPGAGPNDPASFTDPRVQALQQAIDQGELGQAGALRTQVDAILTPLDRALFDARLALLLENDILMEQSLASARGIAPGDARVLATAIEVHAWRGMEDTATQELAQALEEFKGTLLPPEILRAQGIVDICTERMSRVGLKHLEDARAARPDLPFCDRALSQAHMLVGKSHAGTDRRTALSHALEAAEFDPGDPDVRVFLADMLMMNGEWGAGLQVFEEAIAAGENLGPELANHYQKAGIVALGQGKRDIAIEYFLRARELGITDEELRTGLQVLVDEAIKHVTLARLAREAGDLVAWEAELVNAAGYQPGLREISIERSEACTDQAMAALVEEDLEAAVIHFQAALVHDRDSLLVRHYLATVHFELEDFESAAEQWYEVVDLARLDKTSLPEPVHIRLAEALGRCRRMEEGRQVLQAYLDLEPTGEYVDLTRQLLRALPPPPDPIPPREGDGDVPADGDTESTDTDDAQPDRADPSDGDSGDGDSGDGDSGDGDSGGGDSGCGDSGCGEPAEGEDPDGVSGGH